jgi:hypothetical protein
MASGPAFVLPLVAVQWPLANVLLSEASQKRFFATGYHDFMAIPWSNEVQWQFLAGPRGPIVRRIGAAAEIWNSLNWHCCR